MSHVLDAHALLVYLEKEKSYDMVRDALSHAAARSKNLLMTTVNWGEVYYATFKTAGPQKAQEVIELLENFPITVLAADKALAKQAGQYKATRKMSYADCFAAALAKLHRLPLITGDREFEAVEDEIKILWLKN